MGRLCSPILLGVTTVLCSTGAFAADFFVQAMKPGPVTGTPLAVVTLQATGYGTTEDEQAVEPGTFVENTEVNASASGGEVTVELDTAPTDDGSATEAITDTGTAEADNVAGDTTEATTELATTSGAKWVRVGKKDGPGKRIDGPGRKNRTVTTETTTAASTDTSSIDTGSIDVGSTEIASADTAPTDSGSTDTGSTDTGSTDTGSSDTGSTDTGSTDTGSSDTGSTNTGSTDTGSSDTGSTNTGSTDTGSSSTGSTNTGSTGGTTTGSTGGTTTGTTGGTTTGTTGGTTSGGPSTTGGAPTSPTGQTWPSVGSLLASGQVQGGDRIFLMDGYHGPISVQGMQFSAPIVIAPLSGHVAHVDSILIRGSTNVVVQGLKVWATSANAGTGPLIRSYGDTSDLAFTDLDVRGVASSANYMQWSQTDWQNYKRDAMMIDGDKVTLARNRVTGIFHGIKSVASNTLMEENIIDGFAGDGMRANGDNSIVRRNKVQNCFAVSANHMDGFQSFSTGPNGPGSGTVRNLTVEENKIFEWTSSTVNPLRCKLQGISMFDGMYDGVVIRNNIISSRAYHGITINGALNTLVANNTVVHADGVAGNWPWIRQSRHKSGTPSQNVIFANNLVNGDKVTPDASRNVLSVNNLIVTNASNEFTSVAQQDFTLKSTSKAVNAGQAKYAPPIDIIGTARPMGKAPDVGAYENF